MASKCKARENKVARKQENVKQGKRITQEGKTRIGCKEVEKAGGRKA